MCMCKCYVSDQGSPNILMDGLPFTDSTTLSWNNLNDI